MILMKKLEEGVFAVRKNEEGCGWKQRIIQGGVRIINQQVSNVITIAFVSHNLNGNVKDCINY